MGQARGTLSGGLSYVHRKPTSDVSCLFVMAALRSICGHYIFVLFLLLLVFSSPNLSGRRLDVYHTSTHGVALVRI